MKLEKKLVFVFILIVLFSVAGCAAETAQEEEKESRFDDYTSDENHLESPY